VAKRLSALQIEKVACVVRCSCVKLCAYCLRVRVRVCVCVSMCQRWRVIQSVRRWYVEWRCARVSCVHSLSLQDDVQRPAAYRTHLQCISPALFSAFYRVCRLQRVDHVVDYLFRDRHRPTNCPLAVKLLTSHLAEAVLSADITLEAVQYGENRSRNDALSSLIPASRVCESLLRLFNIYHSLTLRESERERERESGRQHGWETASLLQGHRAVVMQELKEVGGRINIIIHQCVRFK